MPHPLHAVDSLYEILSFAGMTLSAALALTLGRTPHRFCGLLLAFETLLFFLFLSFLDLETRYLLNKIKAILLMLAYCGLTLRFPDRWLIVLTALQGFATLVHIGAWIDPGVWIGANGLLLNATGWLMMITLTTASIAAAIQRRDERFANSPG